MSAMFQSLCSYCQQPASFTKEHLWPTSLHKRLYAANQQTNSVFWLARLQREIPSEPQIRDVCAHCNNVVLSDLDSYICELFDKTLIHIPRRPERVVLEHNYHLLKRWLLKMSYNSARINESVDRRVLEAILPYILGKSDRHGRSTQLFVALTYPEEVEQKELNPASDTNEITVFEPSMHRVGHMLFRAYGIGQKLLRTVHLRSFSFFIAYWPPGGGRVEQDDFESIFTSFITGAQLLRPSKPSVLLECNSSGAWSSFRESRNCQFVSDHGA